MGDPTFTQQFGVAVQADILRQAAVDRQDWQPRCHGHRRGTARLFRLIRHLPLPFRPVAAHECHGAPRPAEVPGH
jgi:hypothetical protein